MDTQQLVLSKIILSRDLAPVFDSNITKSFFPDPEARSVFETIVDHFTEYGEVPTGRRITNHHPNYPFVKVEETYQELLDDLREMRATALLESALQKAVEALDGPAQDVKSILTAALMQVEMEVSSAKVSVWQEDIDSRLEAYRGYAENEGLKGIPSGFKTIDEATGGFQAGQLVTLAGPPKAGKTTMLLLFAYAAIRHGSSVLLFSFEMGALELFEILDAIHAKVSVSLLRSGKLTDKDRESLEKTLWALPEEMKARLTVVEDPDSVTNMSGVNAKIIQHDPAAVFIDGIYLLEDEGSKGERGTPRAIRNITQTSKKLAKRRELFICITTQINEHRVGKDGIDQSAVFGSQSYAQDSDVLFGLQSSKEDPTISLFKILAARQAARVEVYIRLDREKSIFEELDYNPFSGADDGKLEKALAF